jgi:aspartate-semialdehyde dehydrogenase
MLNIMSKIYITLAYLTLKIIINFKEEFKLGVKLAVVGATGMVGRKILEVLKERNFPIDELYLFSSSKSAGNEIEYNGKKYIVEELNAHSFDRGIDIALFSAGGGTSLEYAPIASSKGCVVVDNSSAWRMDKTVPLVVPEVNPEDIKWNNGIIANPNCSTIQAVVALKPLDEKYNIKRIVYSTYQAVSGAGVLGYEDLKDGTSKKFPHKITNNMLPHIDVFEDNGYTKEEMKMVKETQKIMHRPDVRVTATTVRVPVYYGHSESINLEFEKDFVIDDIFATLNSAPGVIVMDDVKNNVYPMPITAEDKDEVFVGRIRRDESLESGLNLWVVADNIRKGAATNAVQIAELLIKK